MKAVIYARTASQEQSTVEQINLCRDYIIKSGGHIVGIFDDPGASAHDEDRDGITELMKFIDDGSRVDTLVVTGTDRLFRDFVKMNNFLCGLHQLHIQLVVAKQQ